MKDLEKEKEYQQLLREIRIIQLKLNYVSIHSGFGGSASSFKGKGMDFYETRPYVESDDIRSIDWNVTARLNKPYVKVYQEEHEFVVLLAVDVSRSQDFSSQKYSKKNASLRAMASVALSALAGGNKVGFVSFDDGIVHYAPPLKRKAELYTFIRKSVFYQSSKKSNLSESLKQIAQIIRKKSIIFLFSDFLDGGHWASYLVDLAMRHHLGIIQFFDPLEKEFPPVGLVHFEDMETGEMNLLDTSEDSFQKEYKNLFQKHLENTQSIFRSLNLRFLQLDTVGDFYFKLKHFLKK